MNTLHLVPLNLENLKDVKDGLVALMFQKALDRAVQDIQSAPDIDEWRKVAIEVRLKPKCENMQLERVDVEFVVNGKVPNRVTSCQMLVRANEKRQQSLMFNVDSAENVNQMSLLPSDQED